MIRAKIKNNIDIANNNKGLNGNIFNIYPIEYKTIQTDKTIGKNTTKNKGDIKCISFNFYTDRTDPK